MKRPYYDEIDEKDPKATFYLILTDLCTENNHDSAKYENTFGNG